VAESYQFSLDFHQSNHEGVLIDWVQQAHGARGLIINAGAYTHTSVALHDALKSLSIPIIEVHLSNLFAREPFRHHSYISKAATGIVAGLGPLGYELAITALLKLIERRESIPYLKSWNMTVLTSRGWIRCLVIVKG
jgi:3-dehydroquinate dehydratase-2